MSYVFFLCLLIGIPSAPLGGCSRGEDHDVWYPGNLNLPVVVLDSTKIHSWQQISPLKPISLSGHLLERGKKIIQTVLEYLFHTQSLNTTYIGLQVRMQTWYEHTVCRGIACKDRDTVWRSRMWGGELIL